MKNSKTKLYRILAGNTSSNGIFFVLQQTIQLVTFAVLVRLLGLEEFGLLMLAGALIGQFAFLDGGLSAGLQKYIPEFRASNRHKDISRAISGTFIIFSGIGFFIAVLLIGFTFLGGINLFHVNDEQSVRFLFYSAAVSALFQWPMLVFENAGKGFNLFHKLNIILFWENIISFILVIFSALLGFPLFLIFILRFIPRFGSTFFRLILLKKHHKSPLFIIDSHTRKIMKRIFGYSVWVFIISFSSTIVNQLDKIIVSSMLGVSQLPIYVGVTRVLKLVGQLNGLLKSAVLPIASEIHSSGDKTLLNDLSYRGTKIFNAIFGPVTVSIILFANPILTILGGEAIARYDWVLQIGSLILLPVLCRAFLNTIVIGFGHIIRYQSLWSVITSFLYLVICITGIYLFELYGVILAHPITHALMMLPWLYIIFQNIDFKLTDFLKAVWLGQWPSLVLLGILYPIVDRLFDYNIYIIGICFVSFVFISTFISLYLTIEKKYRCEIYKIINKKLNFA